MDPQHATTCGVSFSVSGGRCFGRANSNKGHCTTRRLRPSTTIYDEVGEGLSPNTSERMYSPTHLEPRILPRRRRLLIGHPKLPVVNGPIAVGSRPRRQAVGPGGERLPVTVRPPGVLSGPGKYFS